MPLRVNRQVKRSTFPCQISNSGSWRTSHFRAVKRGESTAVDSPLGWACLKHIHSACGISSCVPASPSRLDSARLLPCRRMIALATPPCCAKGTVVVAWRPQANSSSAIFRSVAVPSLRQGFTLVPTWRSPYTAALLFVQSNPGASQSCPSARRLTDARTYCLVVGSSGCSRYARVRSNHSIARLALAWWRGFGARRSAGISRSG